MTSAAHGNEGVPVPIDELREVNSAQETLARNQRCRPLTRQYRQRFQRQMNQLKAHRTLISRALGRISTREAELAIETSGVMGIGGGITRAYLEEVRLLRDRLTDTIQATMRSANRCERGYRWFVALQGSDLPL